MYSTRRFQKRTSDDWQILVPELGEATFNHWTGLDTHHFIRIWLEDVAAEISRSGNTQALELVGFDISDTHFAKSSNPCLQFVLSDIHKGFGAELHGTFDIVHVRLLLVVITEKQMLNAVGNVVKLLSKTTSFEISLRKWLII
jgi:hypothetical protein